MSRKIRYNYNNNPKINRIDIFKAKQIADQKGKEIEKEATEKAFLYMLAIPLNILCADYWSKTAKRKVPEYIHQVFELYQSVQEGRVTNEELATFLKDMADVTIEAEWLKCSKN